MRLKKVENMSELSRGEICVANFIPPWNGASQTNYFLAKITGTDQEPFIYSPISPLEYFCLN